MFRKITLLGIVLNLAYISAWSLIRIAIEVSDTRSFFADLNLEIYGGYAVLFLPFILAAISFTLLTMSWWQTHCRKTAMSAAFALSVLTVLQCFLLKAQLLGVLVELMQTLILPVITLRAMFWLYLSTDKQVKQLPQSNGPIWLSRLATLLLFLEILLGGLVKYTNSGAACPNFPQCNGVLPYVDFIGAFKYALSALSPPDLSVQIALDWSHRFLALVCLVVFISLTLSTFSSKYPKAIKKAGIWLSILIFIEIGLSTIGIESFMLLNSVGHTLFAALLMLPLIAISFYSRYGYAEAFAPIPQAKPKAEVIPPPLPAPTPVPIPAEKPLEPTVPVAEARVEVKEAYAPPAPESLYLRLKNQLGRTRAGLGGIFSNLQIGQKAVTRDLLDEIEDSLLMADVGIDVSTKVTNHLRQGLEKQQLNDSTALMAALKQELLNIITPCSQPLVIAKQDKPFVILVVGVNGVGKTTTIGKLAKRLQAQGHSVMLAAGDTFRAAAVEQLQTWGQRNNIQVVAQHTGADSASVIFDGIQSAQAKGVNVLIADTAGRLHTKDNLMEELKKVKRIMAKLDETAPHEVLLVLDAGTGQNALSQAKQFNEAVKLTGLALTKLDGTAKGGVIFALAQQTHIPIRFIGVGEGIDDLQDFNADHFIDALFVSE